MTSTSTPSPKAATAPPSPRRLAARDAWVLLAAGLGLALAWRLSDVLMLAFAGMLLALGLKLLSQPLQDRLQISPRWALVLVIALLLLLLVLGSWVAGAGIAEQMQELRETLPQAVEVLRQWLAGRSGGRWLLELWESAELAPEDWQQIAGLATGTLNATLGAVASLVLLVVLGIYLAADPQTYRRGFLQLVPPSARPRAEQALAASGRDLSRWLLGQAVSMLAVGLLTGFGLALVGMPLALSLAVIAGVLEFVPYFGPIVSGVLIVAVALTEGETQALWAAAVCFGVQQAEAYVVQPLAQRWAVKLPPVLGLLAVLIFGILFGLAGVLLAVPLMVLTMTLVQQLYLPSLAAPTTPAETHDRAGTADPQRSQ